MNIRNKKVVLIGAGYWGTNIAKNLIKLNIKDLMIYDLNTKNAELLNKRLGYRAKVQKSLDNLVNNIKNEFFIFATPPSKNLSLIEKALKRNKKIFIEKPGFKNVKEINYLIKKYPNKIKNLTFGYIYMFNNYIKFIKSFVKNKKNGRILYIKFQRQNLGPIRNDVDVSYDLSTHDISILIYLFGKNLRLINHNSHKILNNKISDISNLSFKVKNFYADINNSWINPDKIRRLIIVTSKKMLLFDEMRQTEKISIFNKYAEYPRIENLKNNFFSKKAKIHEGKHYSPSIKDNDSLLEEIKGFITNSKKNRNYNNTYFAKYILKTLEKIN